MKRTIDARGAAHIIGIVGVIVIVLVALIGYKVFQASHADAPGSPIIGTAAKCLDISNNKLVSGTKIQLWGCNGTDAQRWVYTANSLQNRGYCVGLPNNSKTVDTPTELQLCDKSAGQVWTYQSDKTLINPNSGYCLTVDGNKSANGTVVDSHGCNNTSAQFWSITLPTNSSAAVGNSATGITYASWNTKYSNDDGDLGSSVKTIAANAQVIALQEVHHSDNRKEIRDKLLCSSCAYSSNVTDFSENGSSPASLMILWNRSRFIQVGKAGSIHVSDNTTVNDSAGDDVSDKYINWVRLKDIATNKEFYFLDTHTVASVEEGGKPNTNNDKRLKLYKTHLDKLTAQLKVLQADNIPIFLAGDFNVNYRKDITVKNAMFPYVRLGSVNFRSNYDVLKLAGIANDQRTSGSDSRLIDYVWAWNRSDTTFVSEKIISSRMGSDHYPVLVTATLTGSSL